MVPGDCGSEKKAAPPARLEELAHEARHILERLRTLNMLNNSNYTALKGQLNGPDPEQTGAEPHDPATYLGLVLRDIAEELDEAEKVAEATKSLIWSN
jgi:hypothetical protein